MIQGKVDIDGLSPIPEESRPMGRVSYILVMWSTAIIIQLMAIGTFLLQDGLNLVQVITVGVVSALLVALFASLNAFPGVKNGIPFVMQLRTSFGYKGSKVAYVFRIVPAVAWYGIGTWIGALAINSIMVTLFDLPQLKPLYFVVLTVAQIVLAYKGIHSIKLFDAVVAVVIIVMLGYFFALIMINGEMDFVPYSSIPGSWGILFWGGISAATANWATVMLNHSDLMRQVRPATGKTNFLVNLAGISPPWIIMVFFGMLIFIGTGSDDPVAGLISLAPNPIFGVVLLIFIVLAQISSNLTTSVLPAALAFQDLFKMKWGTGVVVASALSVVTAPWVLFTSDWFFTFQNIYSVFLGPILGIMLANYWVIEKRQLNVTHIYEVETEAYKYLRGFSPAAFVALLGAGIVAALLLPIAWLVGMPTGFVLYILLKKAGFERRFEIKGSGSRSELFEEKKI